MATCNFIYILIFQGVEKIKEIAQQIGDIQYNCQVKIPPSEFVEQYRFGLTEVVYQWAKGMVSLKVI